MRTIFILILTFVISGCSVTPVQNFPEWDKSKPDTFENRLAYNGLYCAAFHWCNWSSSSPFPKDSYRVQPTDSLGIPTGKSGSVVTSNPRK